MFFTTPSCLRPKCLDMAKNYEIFCFPPPFSFRRGNYKERPLQHCGIEFPVTMGMFHVVQYGSHKPHVVIKYLSVARVTGFLFKVN